MMDIGAIVKCNGRFREECLDQGWFTSLAEARRVIEAWRLDYNEHRPHTSLRMRTPAAFAAARPFAKPQRSQPAPDATSPDAVAALTAPVLSGGSGFSQCLALRKGPGQWLAAAGAGAPADG